MTACTLSGSWRKAGELERYAITSAYALALHADAPSLPAEPQAPGHRRFLHEPWAVLRRRSGLRPPIHLQVREEVDIAAAL